MPNGTINFKLSDDQKYSYIWALLNPEYNEEGNWTVSYAIMDVYDDYAIAFCIETGSYERVYYKKNDENDSVELVNSEKIYIVDVTEKEKETLETLRRLNGDTYELVNENLEKAEENANACVELHTKIDELNESISTLNMEVENVQAKFENSEIQYAQAQEQISTLTEENESLVAYKKAIETQCKEAVVAEYTDKLAEDVLDTYRDKFEEYTAEELDMHLAYELKKTNASAFTGTTKQVVLPKDTPKTGVEEILSRYKR